MKQKCLICDKSLSDNTKRVELSNNQRTNKGLFRMCMCKDCTKILTKAIGNYNNDTEVE